jgi:hypothetical protein
LAILVHEPEAGLGVGVALVSGFSIPLHRLGIVLRDTVAVGVHEPEEALSAGVAMFSKRAPKPERGCVVAALVGSRRIFNRACYRRSGKTQGQKNSHKSGFEKSHASLVPPNGARLPGWRLGKPTAIDTKRQPRQRAGAALVWRILRDWRRQAKSRSR